MSKYFLYSKLNSVKVIRSRDSEDIKPISKEIWINLINNDKDCIWSIDTPLGKMRLELFIKKNVSSEEIENLKVAEALCFADKNKYPTDFQIAYFGYRIEFVFKRLTKQRLEKMKELGDKLDCYLVDNFTIVSDDKYAKLLDKVK